MNKKYYKYVLTPILIIMIVTIYLNYDYFSFLIFKNSYIFNSNKYEFVNSPTNIVYKFQITPYLLDKNKEEIIINKEISQSFDTSVVLQNIVNNKTDIVFMIKLNTQWKFTSGICLTNGEIIKNDQNIATESNGYIELISVNDENGNHLESSITGFGGDGTTSYFIFAVIITDAEFFKRKSISVEFTGLNQLSYHIVS